MVMKASESIRSSLPLVVQALTERTGIRVEIGGSEAYTDGKVIHLPSLPLQVDETLAGVVRGYADHEIAHCLFTDFSVAAKTRDKVEQWLLNMLEDVRVEGLMSKRYVGCAANLSELTRRMFLNGSTEVCPLNWCLLYARSWHEPLLGKEYRRVGRELEKVAPGLTGKLRTILNEARRQCQSTEDSLRYAGRLAAVLKNYTPPPQKRQENENSEDGKNSQEEKDRNETIAESSETQGSIKGDTSNVSPFSALFEPDAVLPMNVGDTLKRDLEAASAGAEDASFHVARLVNCTFPNLPVEAASEALNLSARLRTEIVGLLQADTFEGRRTACFGRLNTRQLYKAVLGESKVFLSVAPARMKSAAVHLLLDVSGSTTPIVREELISAYAIALALQGVRGISCGVSVFPVQDVDFYDESSPAMADILCHGRRICRVFPDVPAYGLTPLAAAMWRVLSRLCAMRKTRKILIVFTDGLPDSVAAATAAVQDAESNGVEVYGIAYNIHSIQNVIPTSVSIKHIEELPEALSSLLLKTLRSHKH